MLQPQPSQLLLLLPLSSQFCNIFHQFYNSHLLHHYLELGLSDVKVTLQGLILRDDVMLQVWCP